MSKFVNDYQPAAFFDYFEEITAIPRGSGNEKEISDYLVTFAEKHGLFCVKDDINNVFIRKEATPGYENAPAVLLQGHTDMVCEKNAGVEHDFLKDPIPMYRDGDYLKAKGTTLGADDGTAVAFMMAALTDETLQHPTLECLFTVEEETGLTGAAGFDPHIITAKYMINLDADPEGTLLVSCAGGMRCRMKRTLSFAPAHGEGVSVAIRGLAGGHSGASIHEKRMNANKLLGRLLAELKGEMELHLCKISGGSKDNAIPREAEAVFVCDDAEKAVNLLKTMEAVVKEELSSFDENFSLAVEKVSVPAMMMSEADTAAIISVILLAPNGVLSMSSHIEGLVESSVNLGVITQKDGTLTITFSPRSSLESKQDETKTILHTLADRCGFSFSADSRYPGWAFEPESTLRPLACEQYKKLFGVDMKVEAIHAGLECGLIKAKLPNLDIISTGVDVWDIHTPDERLYIPSVEKVWKLLVAILENIK